MPYYNPYQTMLMHYMPHSRSASTSAFASGDAVAAGTIIRGILMKYLLFFFAEISEVDVFITRKSSS